MKCRSVGDVVDSLGCSVLGGVALDTVVPYCNPLAHSPNSYTYSTYQGKLALAVRAQQSAVARADAQARARAAAERAEAAARADLGALHAALASHGIALHYEPG